MRSAVTNRLTHQALLRHGARSFSLAYGEDGDGGLDQAMQKNVRVSCEFIEELRCNIRQFYGSSFRLHTLTFATVHLSAR